MMGVMKTLVLVVLLLCLLDCLIVVKAQDAITASDGISQAIETVINERAGWELMQEEIDNSLYTLLNISGTVQAAATAAEIANIVANKRDLLYSMRDCIVNGDGSGGSGDDWGFTKKGFFSPKGWDVSRSENEQEASCLEDFMIDGAADDDTIVLQHYQGASGYIQGYFSPSSVDLNRQMRNDDDGDYDSRLNPSFVFSTTYQKDVFIMLDMDGIKDHKKRFIEEMKNGARAVIAGLYDEDYAQVITSMTRTPKGLPLDDSCATGFLRMTEANKALMNEYIDNILSNYSGSHKDVGEMFDQAFNSLDKAIESDTNAHSDCQTVMLFASARQPSSSDMRNIRTTNLDYGARIFAYALDSATAPEGWVGGGKMYSLSCNNEGQWYDIEDPEDLPEQMLRYMILLQRTREITEPVWFVRSYTYDQTSSGIGLVGSLPVYRDERGTDQRIVIGVLTVEFSMIDIETYLSSLARGLSFAFLSTENGDLVIHPSYRSPDIVERLPLFYDTSLVESDPAFAETVRGPMVTQTTGFETITVARPLSRGDIGTEGITTIPVKTTFFWDRMESLPLVVVLAFSDAELRAPSFEASSDVDWLLSVRTSPIWDDADIYMPPDFLDSFQEDLWSIGLDGYFWSMNYTCLVDNYRTFSPTLAQTAENSLLEGSTRNYDPNSYMFEPDVIKSVQAYLNNIRNLDHNQNPGILSNVKENALIATSVNRYWRQNYDEVCATDPDVCPFILRYVGFSNQALVTYPGFALFPGVSFDGPTFFARQRSWYQRAESNPGLTTLASPYDDAALGGKVSTVSKTVFADPSLPSDDREIIGVVGIDYPYSLFHRDIMNAAGCALDRSMVTSSTPMCYLMDNAGLIVISPDFLELGFTTLGRTNSDTLPVTLAEPELAEQLVDNGVLELSTFVNFKGTIEWLIYDTEGTATGVVSEATDIVQENPILTVNDDVIAEHGGTVSGRLRKNDGWCTEGEYTIAPVADTNLYLIYIEDYDRDDDNDCRTYSVGEKTNITIDTCDQNEMDYTRGNPQCPNADQRESTTELNRDTNSKCDEDPPKEIDYVAWDDLVAIALVAVTAVLIVIVLILWAIIFKYRATPVILMASPTFIYLQFLGFVVGLATIFLWTGKPTDVKCALRPWVASIAFVLIVGPMFAKTYRIWKLFSGKGFFAQKISDTTVMLYVAAMMVPPLIIATVWTAFEMPAPELKDDHFDNDKLVYRCDGDSCRAFEGAMIGYCGLLLAMGTFFAFRARKAASHFNEARGIGLSVYAVLFCGIVGVTLTYVLLGLPVAYYVVFCVCIYLGIYSVILFVYVPKIRICLLQPEKNVYTRTSSGSAAQTGTGFTGTDMDD